MKCPIDDSVLQMTERSGIEIDYCPQCRGVWLDRGELDKLIDRAAVSPGPTPAAPPATATPSYPPPREQDRRDSGYRDSGYRDSEHRDSGYQKKRKKESFLGDLFDF